MAIILRILDFMVVLLVVMNVSRAVWKAQSLVLSVFVTAAVAIFGLVSLLAASGLTAGSAFHQGALLVFLVAIAVATNMSRASKPVQ